MDFLVKVFFYLLLGPGQAAAQSIFMIYNGPFFKKSLMLFHVLIHLSSLSQSLAKLVVLYLNSHGYN